MNSIVQHNMYEKYGSGIGRIINYFKEANLTAPTFENHSGGFLVTVYAPDNDKSKENITENKNNDPVNDPINDPINDPLNNRQHKIISLIKDNPFFTKEELAHLCSVSLETIKRDIQKLQKLRLIERVGSRKSGSWKILKTND